MIGLKPKKALDHKPISLKMRLKFHNANSHIMHNRVAGSLAMAIADSFNLGRVGYSEFKDSVYCCRLIHRAVAVSFPKNPILSSLAHQLPPPNYQPNHVSPLQ